MPAAKLFCKTGPLAGSSYQIAAEATIGNSSKNTIQLYPKIISSKHARIFYDEKEGCYFLEDLGSRNGTKLDGMRVRGRERLGSLHVITFANTFDFLFQVVPESQRPAAPRTVVEEDSFATPNLDEVISTPSDARKTMVDEEIGAMPKLPEAGDLEEQPTPQIQKTDATPTVEAALERPDEESKAPGQAARPTPGPEEVSAKDTHFVLKFSELDRSFALKPGKNFIGRAVENDVCIDDPSISRRHACIQIREDTVTISDLASKNHTFVDKKQIETEVVLQPGAFIRFGEIEAVLVKL